MLLWRLSVQIGALRLLWGKKFYVTVDTELMDVLTPTPVRNAVTCILQSPVLSGFENNQLQQMCSASISSVITAEIQIRPSDLP